MEVEFLTCWLLSIAGFSFSFLVSCSVYKNVLAVHELNPVG